MDVLVPTQTEEATMLDIDEFFDSTPLSDSRCDVCLGRLPQRASKVGKPRLRHDGCRNAMKRMWIARLRESE
jgi:hypothetical protein